MFKRILKFIKFVLVGSVWSYLYLYASLILTIKIWNFNYLSLKSWRIINSFWNQGGIIKQPGDYGLFAVLLLLIPLWLLGWRYFYKKNFIALLLAPIVWYNKRTIAKYGSNSSRIILKNLGTTAKIDPKEFIEKQLKDAKSDIESREKTSDSLREMLKEKISSDTLK